MGMEKFFPVLEELAEELWKIARGKKKEVEGILWEEELPLLPYPLFVHEKVIRGKKRVYFYQREGRRKYRYWSYPFDERLYEKGKELARWWTLAVEFEEVVKKLRELLG